MQFHENYFNEINDHIAPNLQYDTDGQIVNVSLPIELNEKDKKLILSYLWRIDANRNFALPFYNVIVVKIKALKEQIETELG